MGSHAGNTRFGVPTRHAPRLEFQNLDRSDRGKNQKGATTMSNEIEGGKAPGEIADAVLNWAGGRHVALPGGPGDIPFSSAIGTVSGMGFETTTTADQPNVTEAPNLRGGGAMSAEEIFLHSGFGGR